MEKSGDGRPEGRAWRPANGFGARHLDRQEFARIAPDLPTQRYPDREDLDLVTGALGAGSTRGRS